MKEGEIIYKDNLKGIEMDNVVIRKGRIEDVEYFSPLILFSAPEFLLYLFGSNVTDVLKKLFRDTDNWFSF